MKDSLKEKSKIDESLYSRQIYALGKDVMGKLTQNRVLLTGVTGAGLELAKCVILAGVKKFSLHALTDSLTYKDLASNYYCSEEDIGKPFLEKVRTNLASLNSNVIVNTVEDLSDDTIKEYDTLVMCDYTYQDMFYYNRLCRENNVKFVAIGTFGLAGYLFCDFGDSYVVEDHDGEPKRTGIVTHIEDGTLHTAEVHKLYTGDVVSIQGAINGLNEGKNDPDKLYIVKSKESNKFQLAEYDPSVSKTHDELMFEAHHKNPIVIPDQQLNGVVFHQYKVPLVTNFKSLQDSLNNPDFVMFDTTDWDMPRIMHAFTQALSLWRYSYRLENPFIQTDENNYSHDVFPDRHNEKDKQDMFRLFREEWKILSFGEDVDDKIRKDFDNLYATCAGRIVGVDAVIGSIGAQEVVKAASHKFTPNKQYLYFESLNILPEYLLDKDEYCVQQSRDDAQIVIFGKSYVEEMHKKKVFVVGAGAIGCEHIKNFAMMGVNNITITDMDHIEKSNLNRQFLFRPADIGQPKSLTVAKKAKLMNPKLNIVAHENKVGNDTTHIYNSTFFDELDVVANALDNVEARLFVDRLCVRYGKPLLESGTLGTKGNVQTVVPHLTESYGSVRDPPEETIPVCTLKLFPYKLEHVAQYSRDLFEGHFVRIPSNCLKAAENPDCLNDMTPGDLKTVHEDIETLVKNYKTFKYCINHAYRVWHMLYRDTMRQLIKKYPKDHVDDQGEPFWTGTKIFPEVLDFDSKNDLHLDFVINFSQLWADILKIPEKKRYSVDQRDKYIKFIKRLSPPDEVKSKDVDENEDCLEKNAKGKKVETDNVDHMSEILKLVKEHKDVLLNVQALEFEKDDDSNHHINFITAATNLRAQNYKMKTGDRLTIKGIVGKIIPAIATTTSVVSGLVSLEMYKIFYSQDSYNVNYTDLHRFRYGSFNLGVQSFGFGEPNPVQKAIIGEKYYTIWSKDKHDSKKTLGELIENYNEIEFCKNPKISLKQIEKDEFDEDDMVEVEVGFITYDQDMIYKGMMPTTKKKGVKDPKSKSLRELIEESLKARKKPIVKGKHYLTVSLNPVNDEDVDPEEFENNPNTMINCVVEI